MRSITRAVLAVTVIAALGCTSVTPAPPGSGPGPAPGATLSPAQIACAQAAGRDQARLGLLLRAEKIAPAEYLRAVRDRTAKRARCLGDQAWALAYVAGDNDGDLVPDAHDRCPNTPDLTATDERGCPLGDNTLPGAPSPESVKRAFEALGFVVSPACDTAPDPPTPMPVSLATVVVRAPFPPAVETEVTRVTNQPAGCHVFYEITVHASDPIVPGAAPDAIVNLVFRDTDDQNAASLPVSRFRREFPKGEPLPYQTLTWRVRAMNGNGTVSSWSDVQLGRRFVE